MKGFDLTHENDGTDTSVRDFIRNEALFCGRIVSIRGDSRSGSVTIACPEILSVRRGGEMTNEVRVNFPALSYNKNTKTQDIPANFSRGDYVSVRAGIMSYLRTNEHTGETAEIISVYIDTITPLASKMQTAFGKPGRQYPEPMNEVYLTGIVEGITRTSERDALIRLRISKEHRSFVNGMYFRAPEDLLSNVNIGDTVNVLGMIQTVDMKKIKEQNGGKSKRVYNYQRFVILDMAA